MMMMKLPLAKTPGVVVLPRDPSSPPPARSPGLTGR